MTLSRSLGKDGRGAPGARVCPVDAWIWIVLVVVLLLVAFLMTARKAAIGKVNPTQLTLEPDLIEAVKALAQSDQQITAIKMLRDGVPGLGLAHATNMVQRMAAQAKQPPPANPDLN